MEEELRKYEADTFNEDDLEAMAAQMGCTGGFREYPEHMHKLDRVKQYRKDLASR